MPSSACAACPPDLPSFPTRRSPDLSRAAFRREPDPAGDDPVRKPILVDCGGASVWRLQGRCRPDHQTVAPLHVASGSATSALGPFSDRKSTRLNSSHLGISYAVFCLCRLPPRPTLFPYTTLSRSVQSCFSARARSCRRRSSSQADPRRLRRRKRMAPARAMSSRSSDGRAAACSVRVSDISTGTFLRSEEHTSELQSLRHLVCRLLLVPPAPPTYPLSLHDALPICPELLFGASPILPETIQFASRSSSIAAAQAYGACKGDVVPIIRRSRRCM